MSAKELAVQLDELSEETSIRNHASVVFHGTYGLHECELLLKHQESQDQGGRTAHSHVAVYQHRA